MLTMSAIETKFNWFFIKERRKVCCGLFTTKMGKQKNCLQKSQT